MRTVVTRTFVILSLCVGGLAVSQDLPPEMRADQYLMEGQRALEHKDPATAVKAFKKVAALPVDPPVDFAFWYGRALVEHGISQNDVGMVNKGEGFLKQYLLETGRESEHYTSALALLSQAEGHGLQRPQRPAQAAEPPPVQAAAQTIEQLKASGKAVRGWFGISWRMLTPAFPEKFLEVSDGKGFYVGKVLVDSPADQAGIQVEDIIARIDNKRLESANEFQRVLLDSPGKKLMFHVIRDGKPFDIPAVLAVKEGKPEVKDVTMDKCDDRLWGTWETGDIRGDYPHDYQYKHGEPVFNFFSTIAPDGVEVVTEEHPPVLGFIGGMKLIHRVENKWLDPHPGSHYHYSYAASCDGSAGDRYSGTDDRYRTLSILTRDPESPNKMSFVQFYVDREGVMWEEYFDLTKDGNGRWKKRLMYGRGTPNFREE